MYFFYASWRVTIREIIGEKLGVQMTNTIDSNWSKTICDQLIIKKFLKIIACLYIHNPPGYIDIPMTLTKEAKYLITPFLANLCNEWIQSKNYPDILKTAMVIPLHKGGSKAHMNNYRPISILSPTNKVFKTSLNKLLIKEWEKKKSFL